MIETVRQEVSLIKKIICDYKITCSIIAATAFLGLFCFGYFDISYHTTSTVTLWDAIFSGRILEIPKVMAENTRSGMGGGLGFDGARTLMILPWAIWNFPLWLTHQDITQSVTTTLCMAWSKTFLLICALAVGVVCHHIVKHITHNEDRAKLAAIFFWGSGTLFISIGYSGQDEILYILMFLYGLYCFLNCKRGFGVVFIGFSVFFSPFMILPALVVLVFYTKNIFKIGLLLGLMFAPYAIASKIMPPAIPVHDDYMGWFFGRSTFGTGIGVISIFAVILICIYAFSYCKRYSNELEEARGLLFLLAAMIGCMTVFSWLHFYRYVLCVPFLIICVLILDTENFDRVKLGLIILTFLEATLTVGSFMLDRNCMYPGYVSEFLKNGLSINVSTYGFFDLICVVFPFLVGKECLLSSVIVGAMFFLLFFIWKKNLTPSSLKVSVNTITKIYSAIPLLMIIAFFVLLSFISVTGTFIPGDNPLAPALKENIYIEQHYLSKTGEQLTSARIRTVTWGRNYPTDVALELSVIDSETNAVLFKTSVNANILPNNDYVIFDFKNVQLEKGKWYIFRLKAVGTMKNDEEYIYLVRSTDGTADNTYNYATVTDGVTEESRIFSWNIFDRIVSHK